MNKQAQKPFQTHATGQSEKTAMHYQVRDEIILPIINALRDSQFFIIAPNKHYDSVFQFVGSSNNRRTACSEMVQLSIASNGTLKLKRFIRDQQGKEPIEQIEVNPHKDTNKKFELFLKTFRNELQRFHQKYDAMMTHMVFQHDPASKYKKLTRKSHLRQPL